MAKTTKAKKTASKAAPKAKKAAASEKPKKMAARRAAPVRPSTIVSTGTVFRSIVSTILNSQKKTFTSTEIADLSNASPRHSRRTLAQLTRTSALVVNRAQAPYKYSVRSRVELRRATR